MNVYGSFIGKNYKLEKISLEKDKKTNLYIRPGTIDSNMIKDCLIHYKNITFKDKIILDLGANIGGFTYMALKNECKQIIAVEPDKYNFELLSLNNKNDKAILLEGAITIENIDEITFYFNQSKRNMCSGGIQKTSNRKGSYNTKAYNFFKILEKYKPSIIKIDIEGYEYELLKNGLPDYIEECAIEFHFSSKEQKILYEKTIKLFDNWKIINKTENKMFNTISGVDLHVKRN